MKILGIIGGIAPESTIDYYRSIIALYRARKADGSYPPILINSIDLQRMLTMVGAGELSALTDWLVTELNKLQGAGGELALSHWLLALSFCDPDSSILFVPDIFVGDGF